MLLPKLRDLKGAGPKTCERLARLGVETCRELLLHLPARYEDQTSLTPLSQLSSQQKHVVEGEIVSAYLLRARKPVLQCKIVDSLGETLLLRFFHIAQLSQLNQPGRRLRCFGEARRGHSGWEMVHPRYQFVELGEPLPDTLTPVYPTVEGLSQKVLVKLVRQVLQMLPRVALPELYQLTDLPSLQVALTVVHTPPAGTDIAALQTAKHPAMQRLIMEESLAYIYTLRHRRALYQQNTPCRIVPSQLRERLLAQLPFALTGAQRRVVDEVSQDLQGDVPMLRLVQGDVGAGKTAVAAAIICDAIAAGVQVALMAPTEILAEQHFQKFKVWGRLLGFQVAWLAGSVRDKAPVLEALVGGQAQLVVGTHALFQERVVFRCLGLVVIDEQHRFGVQQRLALKQKGVFPHQLIMTATPIPRTLTMMAYADLDVSIIDELPPGRTPVETVAVPVSRRAMVMERVIKACAEGKQVYWVCTLVEDSEQLPAQSAETQYHAFRSAAPQLKVGLLHGQMKAAEKDAVMQSFKRGELQLLIATTVIEVGVDVPNAALMVIDNAERLGLSQLHQLRGRVGRGAKQSYCVLLYRAPLTAVAEARLGLMRETQDGFRLAEEDLALRGPGEVLGTRQSGEWQLKVTDLHRDAVMIEAAERYAASPVAPDPAAFPLWIAIQQDYFV